MPALNMQTYTALKTTADPERLRRAAEFVSSGLSTGAFKPTVDRVFALDRIADAHRYLEAGNHIGKIVVAVDHESR